MGQGSCEALHYVARHVWGNAFIHVFRLTFFWMIIVSSLTLMELKVPGLIFLFPEHFGSKFDAD